MGGSGVFAGVYTPLSVIAPPERVPVLMGLTGVVFAVGSVLGPIIGGALTQHVT